MRLLAPESARGITVGLWILTGLAFLVGALLPGSSGGDLLGPALLTLSVVWTALLKTKTGLPAVASAEAGASAKTGGQTAERTKSLLLLAGPVLALGIAFTVIREGDRRSFLYVGFAAIVALALGSKTLGSRPRGRRMLNVRARPP